MDLPLIKDGEETVDMVIATLSLPVRYEQDLHSGLF